MGRKVIIAPRTEEFVDRCASLMAESLRQAIATSGVATAALSGGSTVRAPYEKLASTGGIDWRRVLIFFGDDRFVDLDNPYSNYGQARLALIDRVPVPPQNVFPLPVKAANPAEGAREYERIIRETMGVPEPNIPIFDLIHLGMGPDGHTASLFPFSTALSDSASSGLVRMNHAGLAPWVDRVTFSFALINNARRILISATGKNKAGRVKEVLEGGQLDSKRIPVAGVKPEHGELIWLLDSDAASKLGAAALTP